MHLLMLDTPNDPSKVMTFAAVVNIFGNASLTVSSLTLKNYLRDPSITAVNLKAVD